MVTLSPPAAIAALSPALSHYFQGFNSEDYETVASLFAPEGVLRPPFEAGILGPEAIQTYLVAEAGGMRATPLEAKNTALGGGQRQVVVTGRVKALVFTVNVQWTFILDSDDAILEARIKLLASLQDLMQFNAK
jgi:hypothetical protein